jgi:hypothetical protein
MSHSKAILTLGLTLAIFMTPAACRATELDPTSGTQLVDRLLQRMGGCQDFQYLLTSVEKLGSRKEERSCRFFVKDGQLVRIKVVAGRGRGSEAVRDSKGRVRVRKGGLLKALAATVRPDDPRVCSLRGTPFWEVAYPRFLQNLRERLLQPGAVSDVAPDRDRPELLQLVLRRPGARELYWIDARQMFVVSGESFEGEEMVCRFTVSEIRENVGLKTGFFKF